jgi:membrane-associated protein
VLSELVHPLLSLHGTVAYLVVAAVCFGEAALFLGFVLPGETAVIFGGVLAERGQVSIEAMLVVVVVAAILGDSVGYEVGRYFGPYLLTHRPLRGRKGVERGTALVADRGGVAVLLGRFASVLRTVIPGIAGASRLPYRTFLVYNAIGGVLWGVGYTLAGYLLGASYAEVLKAGSVVTAVVVGLGVLVLLGFVVRRRRQERSRDEEAPDGRSPEGPSLTGRSPERSEDGLPAEKEDHATMPSRAEATTSAPIATPPE